MGQILLGGKKPCLPLPKFVRPIWFNSYNGEVCNFLKHRSKTPDFGLFFDLFPDYKILSWIWMKKGPKTHAGQWNSWYTYIVSRGAYRKNHHHESTLKSDCNASQGRCDRGGFFISKNWIVPRMERQMRTYCPRLDRPNLLRIKQCSWSQHKRSWPAWWKALPIMECHRVNFVWRNSWQ